MVLLRILDCDIDNDAGESAEEDLFYSFFARTAPDVELCGFNVRACHYPDKLEHCDGYLISGSPASVYDDEPWISRLQEFVRRIVTAGKPVVGVCFGHQMVAQALGGRVSRSSNGWGVGVKTAEVYETPSWLSPPLSRFSLIYSHQDQVEVLPPGAAVIAGNDHCPCAMFTVGQNVLGIQGHPEFTVEMARKLLSNREMKIGAETVKAAEKSLALPTDETVIARWIDNFYRQARQD